MLCRTIKVWCRKFRPRNRDRWTFFHVSFLNAQTHTLQQVCGGVCSVYFWAVGILEKHSRLFWVPGRQTQTLWVSGSPAQSDSTNISLQILHSLPLCGKMCGTFTVASTECDNVVIEMGDVHKVQRPDVLPWQRHPLVQQFSTSYVQHSSFLSPSVYI